MKGVLALACITVNTIACFVPLISLAIVKLLIPVAGVRRVLTRWLMANGELWIAINAGIFSLVNDTQWDVRGVGHLSNQKWYLVIANHQTWVDIVVLQTVLNRKIPFLKFFIKQELFWFPILGLAWWAMDMPFMKRYSKSYLARHPEKKGGDLEATRKACEKFKNTPTTVINFVEGTRFSDEKKTRRASPYENLLPPRAGGVALALSTMGEELDAILDVTLVYPDGSPPEFWALLCGELRHVVLDLRLRPVEAWIATGDYSNDRKYRQQFHRWLTRVWQEKDNLISQLRAEHEVQAPE